MVLDLFSFLDDIPEDYIAITIYLGGASFILWAWYRLGQYLPKTLAGMTWIILFAVLFAPTLSEGSNAQLAPASIGLMFGVITKDTVLIWTSLIPLLVVTALGFILGYLWSKYQDNQSTLTEK